MVSRGNVKMISREQRESMLQFMVENPDLAKKESGSRSRITKNMKWKELAGILNSCHAGVHKTPYKWSRFWQDWKADVILKAYRLKRHAAGNKGGHSRGVELTALEERLLRFIGGTVVSGVTGVIGQKKINPMSQDRASGSAITEVEGAHMKETPAPALGVIPPAVGRRMYEDEGEFQLILLEANKRMANAMEYMVIALKGIASATETNAAATKVILEMLLAGL